MAARLKGKTGKPAISFAGHYNTVPAGNETLWTTDPFSGEIRDGRIYGLGSYDMKPRASFLQNSFA